MMTLDVKDLGECGDHSAGSVITELTELRQLMVSAETRFGEEMQKIHPDQRDCARNLLHYLALRRQDLRPLQEHLVGLGLSSLGRCESYVLENVHRVLEILSTLHGAEVDPPPVKVVDFPTGRALSDRNTELLLGPKPVDRGVHIMVTMPSEASSDRGLVRSLVAAGMNCMRINCAHDDEASWAAMIENLRRAESRVGRPCRVLMDLAGPKIRSGPVEPGPKLVRWKPHRDALGRTVAPARIWLTSNPSLHPPPLPASAALPIKAGWFPRIRVGDEIRFCDTRNKKRALRIVGAQSQGFWAECSQTTYVVTGTPLRHLPAKNDSSPSDAGEVGEIAAQDNYITLYRGDRLVLTQPGRVGAKAVLDDQGRIVERASIGCTAPEVFEAIQEGESILFDDGKIGGVVEEVHKNYLVVEITRARQRGVRLRADKGINLPDSTLRMPALTPQDRRDLKFIVKHADAVNYSFVRRPEDVFLLQDELVRLGRSDLGVVLKVETRKAVQHLARILLAAMRSPAAGVMIARGDLAVECGWERLAEVQEEILWMCEAAHMPVVWATQVLESLAKTGVPSRAEVTDAAMSVRAECVMLNKGSHIVETVRTLDDILQRMQIHQVKKRPMLRKLSLAEDFWPLTDGPAN